MNAVVGTFELVGDLAKKMSEIVKEYLSIFASELN